jgi:hypothetical protein
MNTAESMVVASTHFVCRDCSAQGRDEWATGEDGLEGMEQGIPRK